MKQWIINLILLLLSIIAILFSLLKVTPFEVTSETYIGTIVSLLSLATAFVIGYQIYNAIEFRKEIEIQKKKYDNIIRRNEEIENKLKRQEYAMQEGFDIISSLIKYNSDQSFLVCGTAFQCMHRALLSSIETDRVDYEMIFGYLRIYISHMNSQTFTSGFACFPDRSYRINVPGDNYGKTLQDVIDEFAKPIKEDEKQIRSNKNFCKIQSEYNRVMKLFYHRLSDIAQNPMKQLTIEETEKITNPT